MSYVLLTNDGDYKLNPDRTRTHILMNVYTQKLYITSMLYLANNHLIELVNFLEEHYFKKYKGAYNQIMTIASTPSGLSYLEGLVKKNLEYREKGICD